MKIGFKKNKKAWVRIVEAVIAIMIILGFILFLRAREEKPPLSEQMYQISHQVLSEAIANQSVRSAILQENRLQENRLTVDNFLNPRIQQYNFDYNFSICNITESCLPPASVPSDKEIFANNIIVSSDPALEYKPKKLALFMWIK